MITGRYDLRILFSNCGTKAILHPACYPFSILGIVFEIPKDEKTLNSICKIIDHAYKQGVLDARKEMREALGIKTKYHDYDGDSVFLTESDE